MRHKAIFLASFSAVAMLPLVWGFQSPDSSPQLVVHAKRPDAPIPQLRSTVSLVVIPAHITTEIGATVTSLGKDNFQLFEDNVEQRIVTFAKDDAPISLGLLIDSSGSMKNKIQITREAASMLFKTSNPSDEVFLIHFGERPKLMVPFTTDHDEVAYQMGRIRPFGRTSLYDAVDLALRQMKQAKNARKAIVIVSDGGDNRSRRTAGEIKNEVLESDVQLYAMGIYDDVAEGQRQSPEEQNGPELLANLAAMTGGRHFPVSNLNELPEIGELISKELRSQYLLGYNSSNPTLDGKYRRVKLTVAAPEELPRLRTQYRRGYYAPME